MPNLERRNRDVITSRREILLGIMVASLVPPTAIAQTAPAKPIDVVTSFSILADLTRQVAKEHANVVALVGPNSDSHVYRASPADAKKVRDAGLIIVNGLGLETFMPRLIKSAGTTQPVIVASNGIDQIEKARKDAKGHDHDHGRIDPHAWQSVDAVMIYVANIRDGLIKADVANEAGYRRNAEAYIAELKALKAEIEKGFEGLPKERRVTMTSHASFAYFAREFGFTFESVQGMSSDAEPSARDVGRVIRLIREKKVQAVFLENMTSPRIAEQIARETGAKVGGTLFSDALSDEKGPAPTYISMMRHNAKTLRDALKPE